MAEAEAHQKSEVKEQNGEVKEQTFEIPKTCKAGVVVNEGADFHVEIQDVPVPTPGPNELLLKLNATGLCMSDVHIMMCDWGIPPMSYFKSRCAGHEGAGVVVAVGSNVPPSQWKVGDRGGVKPLWDTCGSCDECQGGKENYCQKAVHSGLMTSGTYQQYITSPARYTSRIPDGVSDHVAGPIMCSASTMHRALVDSGLKTGQWVVFPGGGGGVGIQGVQLAKIMGMRPIVIDTGAAKKKLSLEMGAESFIDFKEHEDVAGEVKRVANGVGAHGVIVTAYQAYEKAISYIGERIGGVVVCVALPPKDLVTIPADPSYLVLRNLKIIGTLVGTMEDTTKTLEYAQRGLLKQICEVRGLSKMPESVQQLRRGEVAGRVVIDFNMP